MSHQNLLKRQCRQRFLMDIAENIRTTEEILWTDFRAWGSSVQSLAMGRVLCKRRMDWLIFLYRFFWHQFLSEKPLVDAKKNFKTWNHIQTVDVLYTEEIKGYRRWNIAMSRDVQFLKNHWDFKSKQTKELCSWSGFYSALSFTGLKKRFWCLQGSFKFYWQVTCKISHFLNFSFPSRTLTLESWFI